MTGDEVSAPLFLDSNLVNAFPAAAGGTGAFEDFSFLASGPKLTDLDDPVFGFLAGGGLASSSSSLKHRRSVIIGIQEASTEQ